MNVIARDLPSFLFVSALAVCFLLLGLLFAHLPCAFIARFQQITNNPANGLIHLPHGMSASASKYVMMMVGATVAATIRPLHLFSKMF